MAKGLERTQLAVWRLESRDESTGNWGQVVKSFINHMLDWEIDLDLQRACGIWALWKEVPEFEAEEQIQEKKERGGREGVRRSGRGTARPFRS